MSTEVALDTTPSFETPTDLVLDRPRWQYRAACRGADPALFTPSVPSSEARAICATCTVSSECLAFALEDANTAGVWAGTSEQYRRRLRRQQPRRPRRPPRTPTIEPDGEPERPAVRQGTIGVPRAQLPLRLRRGW